MPNPVIHLFKPGTHIDMGGQQLTFSESDLSATVAAYDPAKHEAPLCIGHPQDDAPAYGWVQSLQMAADGPEAIPHQVNADFAELHKSGAFKKVSASFYPPASPHNPVPGVYYLRHIAFLGAQPPAIKGLRAAQLVNYAEQDDCITIEFSEETPAAAQPAAPAVSPQPAAPEPQLPTKEEHTVTPEEAADLKAQNEALKTQLAAANAAHAKEAADRAHEKNLAFAEQLANDTRIGKDSVPVITAALDALQSVENLNFGEGDAAKPLHQVFSETLSAMPPRVEFGETATSDNAAVDADQAEEDAVQYAENTPKESIEMDKKIRAYMKKHNVDYKTAAFAVNS
jgi:hypothetical protein